MRLACALTLAILFAGVACDAHAQLLQSLKNKVTGTTPEPTAPATPATVAATPETPEAALAARIVALHAALRADATLAVERRKPVEAALARLEATVGALNEASAWLAAEQARRDAAVPLEPIDVMPAFSRWVESLSASPDADPLWAMSARLADELRDLRSVERNLQLRGNAMFAQGRTGHALWEPLPLELLMASLPDAPTYVPQLARLAADVEQRRLALAAEIDALRANPMGRIDRLRAQRAALATRIELATRKSEHVAALLERSVEESLEAVGAFARSAASAEGQPGEGESGVASELLELTDEVRGLYALSRELTDAAVRHDIELEAIDRLGDDTRDRVAVTGSTHEIGLVLLADLERTLPPAEIGALLSETRRKLADLTMRLVDLRGSILAARDPHGTVSTPALLARLRAGERDDDMLASMHFRMLLTTEAATSAVADALRGDEAMLVELDRRNRELRELLSGRLLWTRSHPPVDAAWFANVARRSTGQVAAALEPRERVRAVQEQAEPGDLRWFAAALAIGAVAWLGVIAWQYRRLSAIAARGDASWSESAAAVLRASLVAIPFTLAIATLVGAARAAGTPFASGLDSSLFGATWLPLWTVHVLVTLVIVAAHRGAGTLVLGWTEPMRRTVRWSAVALMALIIPGHATVMRAWYAGDLEALQFESRAWFILGWTGAGLLLWFLLRSRSLLPDWDGAMRRLLQFALAVAALAVVVASALGYQITSLALARQLEGTIGVLCTLLLVHAVARRAVGARTPRMPADESAPATAPAGDAEHATEAAALEAAAIEDDHAQRTLATTIAAIGAGALAMVWSGLMPALRQLDEVALWHVNTGSDDARELVAISLLDVLGAVAASIVFVVAFRLLPRLLDALLRDRTRVAPGTRYAAGALLRYVIIVVGLVMTFGLIGVRWSHMQWMAAALTVGLGFGLQEIFANFVSGLILLFERPVRVGDVVTVGDVTGTVTKISTRATTVLDFDRREVMIPNKALITERLVNWSLTSGRTRITVRVPVAFSVDPDLVHRLLLKAAAETPAVLPDPEPVTVLTGFGRSNMDFELRACVADFEERLPTANALYSRILTLFAGAGVTVDYEQIEVRTLQEPRGPLAGRGRDLGNATPAAG